VDGGAARHVVAAAANGDLEAQRARQLHGLDDGAGAAALSDERRLLVDEPVVHAPDLVVLAILGPNKLAVESASEISRNVGRAGAWRRPHELVAQARAESVARQALQIPRYGQEVAQRCGGVAGRAGAVQHRV